MPIFIGACFSRARALRRFTDDDPFRKGDAGSAPKCASRLSTSCRNVAAVNRVGDRVRVGRRKLAAVALERLTLACRMVRHVDDERRRRAVVDEVVADPVRPPRIVVGGKTAQAAAEDRGAQHVARGDVVGMAIVPVRDRDRARPMAADDVDGRPDDRAALRRYRRPASRDSRARARPARPRRLPPPPAAARACRCSRARPSSDRTARRGGPRRCDARPYRRGRFRCRRDEGRRPGDRSTCAPQSTRVRKIRCSADLQVCPTRQA